MVQLILLYYMSPKTPSSLSKIQTGFSFLVLAYPGYPGKEAVKLV